MFTNNLNLLFFAGKKDVSLLSGKQIVAKMPNHCFTDLMRIFRLLTFLLSSVQVLAQNEAPVLTATGQGFHCRNSATPIVETFTITDPDDAEIEAIFIQVTTNYNAGEDLLTLTGNHPNINASWSQQEGKLTLAGIGGAVPYVDLIQAVNQVVYTNSNLNATGLRTFSITIGQANYLPSTGHYYRYIPQEGINWNAARSAAASSTYFGLQGYLATLSSFEEAALAGEQASGTGWIGGTDAEEEGTWKWVTGPEAGQTFWIGDFSGSTPNFAFWNSGEPNNVNNEDYAHITFPGIGAPGSWNDLSPTGEPSGPYRALGYVVEYGGMPGDPTLQIATSTTLELPQFPSVANTSRCGAGTVTLQSSVTNAYWFDVSVGGTPLAFGGSFTTPELTQTTTFYVSPFENECSQLPRIPVTVTVESLPQITVAPTFTVCERNSLTLTAQAGTAIVRWYDNETTTTILAEGDLVLNNVTANRTLYVAAWNGNCSSLRVPVEVVVIETPDDSEQTLTICRGTDTLLTAGLGATYSWSTGSILQSIRIDEAGAYGVVITLPTGCSYSERFIVVENPVPDTPVLQFSENVVTLTLPNVTAFEYSLDNLNFQSDTQLALNRGGEYTLFVRDLAGCEVHRFPFLWLRAPKFFTPNGDSFNDFWTVEGMVFYRGSLVRIFDRYGRLLVELNDGNPTWDGTINNNSLPANDYWFEATFGNNALPIRGHFSLVR